MPFAEPKKKSHKLLWIIGIIVTVLALATAGVFLWLSYREAQETRARLIEEATPRVVVPAAYFAAEGAAEKNIPSNIKGIEVKPGTDFYTKADMSEAEVSTEIDKLLEKTKALSMDTLYVDTQREGQVIFASSVLQSTPVDALKLLCEKASASGMSVSAVFHATGVKLQDGTLIDSHLVPDNRTALSAAAAELAAYSLTTVEIDDYYVERGGKSFSEYASYGDFGDYETWLTDSVNATIRSLVQSAHMAKPALPVGIKASSVWANSTAEKEGSSTKASFQALKNGHADTKTLVEDKTVDFINVSISTSRTDSAVPFGTAAAWWGKLCKASNIPMYITHAAEKAGSGETGWNGTDELARQVSAATKISGYQGSVFSGLARLVENPGGSTDNLVKYLAGEYNDKELNTDLTITLPEKHSFVTYEEAQQFRMKFDPNQEVLLDGEKVVPTERGGASVWKQLKVGKNTFVLEHKGKKTTYTIERRVVIFQSVTPTKDMRVAGGSTIEFNAMAYKGSTVTASINGRTITLKEGGGQETEMDSAYVNYQGSYTVPKATNKEQKIGRIVFKGSYQGYSSSANGASITIDKLPDEVDPDKMTGQVVTQAVVKTDYANTYPFLTTPGYPQGILYQLPRGTQDIVESQNGNFVNLRSGITVHSSEVSLQQITFPGNNNVTQMEMGIEGNDTVLKLTMGWKAPFSLNISPYPNNPVTGTGFSFVGNTVTILLDYTTTIDSQNISGSFDGSPVFSGRPSMQRVYNKSRNIYQYQLTMSLNQQGRYYGAHATWEDNTLVFRFNHPGSSSSLSGVKVAVDAGHGGTDNGTMAGSDILEKDLNLIMADKVAAALESYGATVIRTRPNDSYVSLDNRVAIANNNMVDLFISCHQNSAGANSSANGVETYFNTPFSQPLASSVQNQLAQYLNNRGAKGYNFQVTREKQYPSILIEFCFLSNPNDEAFMLDSANQDALAAAVAQGVLDYYS